MTRTFNPLSHPDDFERVLSSSEPLVIFKHSPTCGISAQAYDEIAALLDGPPLGANVYLVDVWTNRTVSNAIANRLRIRHESPQALLVRRGRHDAAHEPFLIHR